MQAAAFEENRLFNRSYETRLKIVSAVSINLARTIYLTSLAWSAMKIGGSFASVGQTLLWSNVANLIASPFVGIAIDRFNRKALLILTATLFFIVCSVLALTTESAQTQQFFMFTSLAFSNGVILSVLIAGQEALLHAATAKQDRHLLGPVVNAARQIGLVLGALSGGFLIAISPEIAFTAAGFIMLCSVLVLRTIDVSSAQVERFPQFSFQDIAAGLSYMRATPVLCSVVLTSSAYAIGLVVNASLPSYIKETLELSVWHYGLVDGCWSIGALCAALALGRLSCLTGRLNFAKYGLLVMAGTLIALGFTSEFYIVILLFTLCGAGFSFAKVVSDSSLFRIVEPHMFGRVRTNIGIVVSTLGIIIYLIPTLIENLTPVIFLRYASVALTLSVLGCYLLERRATRLKTIARPQQPKF